MNLQESEYQRMVEEEAENGRYHKLDVKDTELDLEDHRQT